MRPQAYEGNEPYIFISYAHRDKETVYRILSELQRDGYRFWYDDGIVPGSEWPENIAHHLNEAAVVVTFITQNSVASSNVRREVNYSLSKNKPFLSVVLEETEMSPGLELQLSAQQSVIRGNYDTWEKFIGIIESCPDLGPCRTVQEPEEGKKTAPAAEVTVTAAEEPAASKGPEPAPEKPVRKKEQVGKKKDPEKSKPAKAGGKGKWILLAAVAVVAMISLFSALGKRPVTFSWGQEVKRDVSYLTVREAAVTQDDLKQLASFKKLSSVEFVDCDLSACDFGAAGFRQDMITTVELEDCTGMKDYSFLKDFTLYHLVISGDPSFTDLGVIDTAKLTTLDVSGTGVTDLGLLSGADPLNELNISRTGVTDCSPLVGLSQLRKLYAAECGLTSLDSLTGLNGLTVLDISGCALSHPDGRAEKMSCLKLETLRAKRCGVRDLSAFSNCTVLKKLDVSGNPELSNMGWLDPQNYETLKELDLSGTGLDREQVSFVERCGNLTGLNVRGLPLEDLGFCKTLSSLECLAADDCSLTDISGLKPCTALEWILLSHNKLTGVDGLSGMEPGRTTVIDLSHNQLKDLSGLPGGEYKAILVHGNPEKLISTLSDQVAAYEITGDWYDGIENSAVAGDSLYSDVYLTGCPENRRLKLEEAIGKYTLHCVTAGELDELLKNDELAFGLRTDDSHPAIYAAE